MKKVFISYANNDMSYSLKRIGQQAYRLNIFDDVLLYTPEKLPAYIVASPLMEYKRGAGYWVWKPAIISETLKKYGNDTIVIYADAGCSLYPSPDWTCYFDLLKDYDTLCFEYRDEMPEWQVFGQTSTKIKYWTKQITQDYFKNILEDEDYGERYNKIWGGLLLCRNTDNIFIHDWLKIMLEQPELIMDPDENERVVGNRYLAFHKHDQCILTPLAHLYKNQVKILDAKMETDPIAAVIGSRIRVKSYKEYCLLLFKEWLRSLLSKGAYRKLKAIVKSFIK